MSKSFADEVIEYVLETEFDDFWENPSKDHVYYKAYASFYGVAAADKFLKDAKDSVEEEND